MYFEKFPKTVYTLDEYKSGQIVTDILRRTKFVNQLVENFAFFDEYDVQDGETPEIVADLFYNNPQLHWIILQANEIVDPRFEWPLDEYNLYQFTSSKYNNPNAIHHYENNAGNVINGNVLIQITQSSFIFVEGDVVLNVSNNGVGFVNSVIDDSSFYITVTQGGFQQSDIIRPSVLASNIFYSNVNSTTNISGIPVTNFDYESELNETKRRIKVIKPELVSDIINNFEAIITR